ncbi:hypothetical protein [Gordonia bronchialis]|nr:hypothetical protein [Gordonia bronchialis]MCC3323478.1 hypothetical protein [Gordonia bronchialis]
MTDRDVLAEARESAEHLRRVLAAIDAGELTATPTEYAAFQGAIVALDALSAE